MLPLDYAQSIAKKYSVPEFTGTVIYSAAIGDRDDSPPFIYPTIGNDDVLFAFFSSKPSNLGALWRCILVDAQEIEPVYLAKAFKVFPHVLFPNAKITVWIDANLALKSASIALQAMRFDSDLALFRHPTRNNIKSEAFACARLGKGDREKLLSQVSCYLSTGYPLKFGLFAGWFLVRRPTKMIEQAMNNWWIEINKYTSRDQISLPYTIWNNDIRYSVIQGDTLKNDCIEWTPHRNSSSKGPFLWQVAYSVSGRVAPRVARLLSSLKNSRKR